MKQPKDVCVYVHEVLDCIADIESYVATYTKASFFLDKKTQDAVMRKIETIGEIVKRLPSILKTNAPHIPWKDIVGMRDILIHEYASVDLNETWVVITVDIPKLKRNVQELLQKCEED